MGLFSSTSYSAHWKQAEKDQALKYQDWALTQAEAYNRKAGKAIDKAYTDALAQTQVGADRARANISAMNKANLGAASTAAMSRGLSGTTVQQNLMRGVSNDTAQQYSDLERQLADKYGAVSVAKGQAKAATLGQLAALYPQFSEMKTGALSSPTQIKMKSNPLGSLLAGIGGNFLGSFTGGLGEGMASGMFKK